MVVPLKTLKTVVFGTAGSTAPPAPNGPSGLLGQDDLPIGALWSQIWAFLGWYNALQLVSLGKRFVFFGVLFENVVFFVFFFGSVLFERFFLLFKKIFCFSFGRFKWMM